MLGEYGVVGIVDHHSRMFSDFWGQDMCLRVVECPPSSRVHIRRVWCRWNRGPPQRFTCILKFKLHAHILCSRMFSDLGQNMCLRVVEYPLSRRVHIRRVWCSWNRGPQQGFTWLLKFELRAHILCSRMFSDFGSNYVSPRDRMSSKPPCPY